MFQLDVADAVHSQKVLFALRKIAGHIDQRGIRENGVRRQIGGIGQGFARFAQQVEQFLIVVALLVGLLPAFPLLFLNFAEHLFLLAKNCPGFVREFQAALLLILRHKPFLQELTGQMEPLFFGIFGTDAVG